MGRDLLQKPNVPIPLQEEGSENDSGKAKKLGVKGPRGRDLGGVPGQQPSARTKAQAQSPAKAQRGTTHAPAFKAAYFNEDTSGVNQVNQRSSAMAALRGQQGAADLRKVVLPPAVGVEHPEPAVLRQASALMGLEGVQDLDLEGLLARQSEWAQGDGVTPELLQARLEQLEAMVEARKSALARMRGARWAERSVTVQRALEQDGRALDECDDVASEGAQIVQQTAQRAEGMHARIAKALGIKRRG